MVNIVLQFSMRHPYQFTAHPNHQPAGIHPSGRVRVLRLSALSFSQPYLHSEPRRLHRTSVCPVISLVESLSCSHLSPLSHSESTLTKWPASVASKRLTKILSHLESTLTKNPGRRSGAILPPDASPSPMPLSAILVAVSGRPFPHHPGLLGAPCSRFA
jgi:hypothetical protein